MKPSASERMAMQVLKVFQVLTATEMENELWMRRALPIQEMRFGTLIGI
jgi:hypothetical protein